MAGKRVIGSIIASVILSVVITGGVSYLILPIVFPNMTKEEEGIVLQSIYSETSTPALLADNNLTYQKIPDTEASITIQENSKISVTFNAMFMLMLDSSFQMSCVFNISIVIPGYGNQSYTIVYFRGGTSVSAFVPVNFYGTFVTDPLPANTYQVEVYWKSFVDPSGDNYLWLNSFLNLYIENPRSLTLLELT
ncbi:MAG: hypothetical protein ACXABG_10065 [Promethearchaeota archaeon]|jgi:hypothetical protein